MPTTSFSNGCDVSMQVLLHRLDRVERQIQALERGEIYKSDLPSSSEALKERFSEYVTIIGLREAISSRNSGVRCLWITIFIVCLISMGFFVFKTYTEYIGEPTATKVKLMEEHQYEYPTMLFCPDTWLDTEKAIRDGLSVEGLQYALGYLINYYVNAPSYRIDNYVQAKSDFFAYYNKGRYANLVDFFKSIALDSEIFFYKCPFCLNQTFKKVIMSEAVCYEILMHPSPGHAPVVSSLDTLEVIVPDRSAGLLKRRAYWRLFLGSDLRLGESTRRYAEIYPRRTNTVQFITHRFISVGKAGNPCMVPSKASNYSHARCVVQCFVEKYGGLTFLMTACSTGDLSNCDNSLLTPEQTFHFYPENLWERLSYFHQGEKGGEEAPAHCYRRCPPSCERRIYTIDVQSHQITPVIDLRSAADHPDQSSNDSSDTMIPNGRYRNNISTPENLTRIYFLNSAAVYGGVLTFREVSTYSFETMVGNVGGMMSLWTGVSIMSIIQLVMFFTTECCACNRRRHTAMNARIRKGIFLDGSTSTGELRILATVV